MGEPRYPASLSPLAPGDAVAADVQSAIWAGLVGLDSSQHWFADLAQEVPTTANRKVRIDGSAMVVSYRLRKGAAWSDGQPITADDVAFTASAATSLAGYDQIEGVTGSGLDVEIRFRTVYPAYLQLFGFLLPRHRLGGIERGKLAGDAFWRSPDVVDGPFAISDVVAPGHISLVRNPRYSGAHRAYLDRLNFRIYADEAALVAAARRGDVQLALNLRERPAPVSGTRAMQAQRLGYTQLTFNQAAAVWAADRPLRQALGKAVDRGALARTAGAVAAAGPMSPLQPWSVAGAPAPLDLAQVRRELDSDGWKAGADGVRTKSGRRLQFTLTAAAGDGRRVREEDALVHAWTPLGAAVTVSNRSARELFGAGGALETGQFEAALFDWTLTFDPAGFNDLLKSGGRYNYSRCQDPAIEAALDAGSRTLDSNQRRGAYERFQRAYANAACEVPFYRTPQFALASARLHNVVLNAAPAGATWNAFDWWIGT